jgi:hypothetical protein
LIRRWGEKFERPVHYTLSSTTGRYWPADAEDAGTVLLLERQNRVCISIKVQAIEARVEAAAAATFHVL